MRAGGRCVAAWAEGMPAQMLHRATDSVCHSQRATAVWRILRSKCGVLSIGSRAEEAGASQDACVHFDGRDAACACNAQAASAEGKASAAWRTWPFSEWRSFKNGNQLREDTRVFVRVLGRALCTEQTASIWPSRKLPRTGLAAMRRVTLFRTHSYYTGPTLDRFRTPPPYMQNTYSTYSK